MEKEKRCVGKRFKWVRGFFAASICKGGGRVTGYLGTLAALSLTPIRSLRHGLVRSHQSAHEDVAGFLRY